MATTSKSPKRHPEGKQVGNILLRNGHWYARVKIRGRQVWRSAPDKDSAQKLLGDLREDKARERVGLPRVQRATLKSWATDHYLPWAKAHKRSAWRDEVSLSHLLPVLGHFRLAEITKARVESYQRSRLDDVIVRRRKKDEAAESGADETAAKGTAPAGTKVSKPTVNREVACLRKILSHAVDAGELEVNPLVRLKMLEESPMRQPTLEPEDEVSLLKAAPPWLRPMLRFALASGGRQGELIALRWRHVNFDEALLTIADSKSGDSRRIPIHPVALEELRARRGLPEGYVFAMPDGSPVSRYSVTQAFKRAARAIGRPDLRWHDTRHVAASRLLATGASLLEVAAFTGHKTLIMAKRYSHVSPVRLANLVAAMPASAPTVETEVASKKRGARKMATATAIK